MNDPLDGKQIIVTGGTGFLGSAIVRRFLDSGAICHVTWQLRGGVKSLHLEGT